MGSPAELTELKEREGLTRTASQSSPFSFRRRAGDEVAGHENRSKGP
jgi:hypothetical protein